MAAHQVVLECREILVGDAFPGQGAETGIDAVDGLAAGKHLFHACSGLVHGFARGGGEAWRGECLGIGQQAERQGVAIQFKTHAGVPSK